MLKNIILMTTLFGILSACSGSKSSETVAEAPVESTSVGPYAVDFNNDAKTYQHNFNIRIAQDEGKVEYNIFTSEIVEVELLSAPLQVTGCPASQVLHQIIWFANSTKPSGIAVKPGATFKTIANTQGTLMHSIRGLKGCERVDLTTTLHQKPKQIIAPRKCQESSDLNCKVEMYCTEPGYKYTEVEVWKESWGTTLRKFNVNSSGSRTMSNLDTVSAVASGNQMTYRATNNSNSLSVNLVTGVSLYTIYAAGQSFPIDLTCQSYLARSN